MINTIKHLGYKLQIKPSIINHLIVNIDSYYHEKVEPKLNKDGSVKLNKEGKPKTRTLHPSIGILKLVQKRIQKNILTEIKMPDYAYGGIKGRDNIKNAKCHQGKKYVFTTDLKDFFPTITHSMVFKMFRSLHFSPTVSRLLTQLTTYKGLLPQGTHTSTAIANLVFVKTGLQLESFAKEKAITFTSFIDDLSFSSPRDFKQYTTTILELIKIGNFKIAHQKTNYKTRFPVVTGLVVKNNCIAVTNEYKETIGETENIVTPSHQGKWNYYKRVIESNLKKNIPTLNTIKALPTSISS